MKLSLKSNITLPNPFFHVSNQEKIFFAQHLAMIIKSGMSTIEGIELIQNQTKNTGFKKILGTVIKDVQNGQFLSRTLNKYPNVFGAFFINMIRLGETSGTLSENLLYLSQEMRKRQQLESKVRSAMIYPVIILITTISITSGIIFFVIPKILPIFASLKITLPLTTRILIGSISFVKDYFLLLIIGITAIVFAVAWFLRIPSIRYRWDRGTLTLPLLGKISSYYHTANITRTMGVLLKSGITIIDALEICTSIMTNSAYRKALEETRDQVQRGSTIYKYFATQERLFPSMATRIIEIGERTGNLDTNLNYLSDFYENELDELIKNLTSTIEPAMLLLMGALVGFVAISIITPIYQITQSLSH